MAITLRIYSNANTSSKSITVDFLGDILAASDTANVGSSQVQYYFKFTTGSKDDRNLSYAPKIVLDLSDLSLNKLAQSSSNTTAAYTSISNMVTDYVYDYVSGHTENQYAVVVNEKRPMKS